jgi:N-acylneuraminate cytidylyltransferase
MAAIARSLGAEVIQRPAHLASDSARIDDAARHAVTETEKLWPPAAADDTPVAILYGNVPVRPPDLIDRAIKTLRETRADSVQSYAPVGKFHPWWTARVDPASGIVRPWEGDTLNHNTFRRQDLPPAHIPDGGILVVTRRALFNQIPGVTPGPHAFFGLDRRGILNPEGAVIDIDSPIDLIVADAVLRTPPH